MQYGIQHHVEIAAKAAGAVIFNQHRKVLLVQELHRNKKGVMAYSFWQCRSEGTSSTSCSSRSFRRNGLTS